ncbi:TetR/AcrR family transcriptional regulator [Rhodococcus triatomae]|uniref:DNA-binding transcriptional regulator, AcrR family n=1 Tax=Rhodococcus triatomae TaxID=300028 RepID=A0A1G7ZNQ0_9NOCA|nr:TetR/AcrR family transcriptional regulator [Rhodococcus triatomae]QNG17993.1 TetR/AcrR family transcriptional regulator [Rhodococcus triatomae]QNG22339.1 TetR/AcrR family transcriptional regulator [Rhodococcus triatomae]SDH10381.1 DNA-binding transcriptional regulator, AcrR family [Rhodococcus triatomae]
MSPDERREQLLDVVLEIIDTRGVAAVSMDAVARGAGVTRPVVYGLFSDTDDILRSSLDREERRAMEQVGGAIPVPGEGDVVDAFGQLIEAFLRAVDEAPQRWRAIFMVADSGTPAFHHRVEHGRALLIERCADALRASDRVDGSVDVELLAHHLHAALWGAGRLLLVRPDTFPLERLRRSLHQFVSAVVP